MATPAQIEANRNAEKSTAARTAEGKARTRRNSTRHGLCATVAIMADEGDMEKEFQILLADLREEHQPDGPTEDILVYKMAESFFFTNRAQVLLAERLTFNCDQFKEDDSKQAALMLRYHTTADRAFNKNLLDLRKLQKERRKEEIGSVSQKAQEQTDAQPESAPAPSEKTAEIPCETPQKAAHQPFPARSGTEVRALGAMEAAEALFATVTVPPQPLKKAA